MKVYLNSFDKVSFVNLITKKYMFTFELNMDNELPEVYNLKNCIPRPDGEKLIDMSHIAFFKAYKLLGGILCKPQEY